MPYAVYERSFTKSGQWFGMGILNLWQPSGHDHSEVNLYGKAVFRDPIVAQLVRMQRQIKLIPVINTHEICLRNVSISFLM